MSTSPERTYWVCIMTNRSGTLYIGMTNNLVRRIQEHRMGRVAGFTEQYKNTRLIHAEPFQKSAMPLAVRSNSKAGRVPRSWR